jgi:hypothetical protein
LDFHPDAWSLLELRLPLEQLPRLIGETQPKIETAILEGLLRSSPGRAPILGLTFSFWDVVNYLFAKSIRSVRRFDVSVFPIKADPSSFLDWVFGECFEVESLCQYHKALFADNAAIRLIEKPIAEKGKNQATDEEWATVHAIEILLWLISRITMIRNELEQGSLQTAFESAAIPIRDRSMPKCIMVVANLDSAPNNRRPELKSPVYK